MQFDIHWHETLPSTNTYLKEWAARETELTEGTVVVARKQEAGRGRRGRSWYCIPERDLAFSILVKPVIGVAELPSLPLCAALAVSEALIGFGVDAQIKWPNDVRRSGKKMSGILVESVPGAPSPTLIVGIGINVNASISDLESIDQPATSLSIQCGHDFGVATVLDSVLNAFSYYYNTWNEEGFSAIREAWLSHAEDIDSKIDIQDGDKTLTGIVEGIGPQGALLLRDTVGVLHHIFSGDLEY